MARKRVKRTGSKRKTGKKAITARQKSARRKNIAVARAARKKGKRFKMSVDRYTGERSASVTKGKLKGREGHMKKILKESGFHSSVGKAIQRGITKGTIRKARITTRGRVIIQGFAKKGQRGASHYRQGSKGIATDIRKQYG
jgi:hypothetical protein